MHRIVFWTFKVSKTGTIRPNKSSQPLTQARKSNELSKAEYGRMPWHDVAMGVIGDCVYDIAEHFILVQDSLDFWDGIADIIFGDGTPSSATNINTTVALIGSYSKVEKGTTKTL